MKKLLLSAAAVLLTATTVFAEPDPRVTATDIGDTVTTHMILSTGGVELNSILDATGSPALAGFVVKYVARNYLGEAGRIGADMGGALGTCHNIAVLSGSAPQVALTAGVLCAGLTLVDLPPHEPETEEDCDRNERLVAGRVCL